MLNPTATHASQFLATVPQEWQAFRFGHGVTVKNMRELAAALGDMNVVEFEQHVCGSTNDVAAWVDMVIGDRRLATKLRLLSTLDATRRMVCRRVDELSALLPPGPSVEQIAAEHDIALANAMRFLQRTAQEPAMAVAATAQTEEAAPRAKRAPAKRTTAPRAAAQRAAPKQAEPKKKGSLFGRLLGW